MLNKLFKRMAPLVAGVLLVGAIPVSADYPTITDFYYSSSYDVQLETQEGPTEIETFWWRNGTQQPGWDGDMSVNLYPSGANNIAVYVYLNHDWPGTNHYSWASIDVYWGTNIYNGP